jgi:hypothetical protein
MQWSSELKEKVPDEVDAAALAPLDCGPLIETG